MPKSIFIVKQNVRLDLSDSVKILPVRGKRTDETEEGTWDLVGNNTAVFFVRDSLKFPDFIHTQKRHPVTGLRDAIMQRDFRSLSPESLHQVTWLFGDRAIPATLRHMDGFGSHTFSLWNNHEKRFWLQWHLKTQQGIKCMKVEEAGRIAAENPDYHRV